MQAVLKFPSKCSFSPPLTRVSAVLSASGHPQPHSSKENSDFWGQSQKYVAIGSAQCRHRPAGGQSVRDIAARTDGAEHPAIVHAGCGACKIVCLKVQSDVLQTCHKAPHSANTPAECSKHAAENAYQPTFYVEPSLSGISSLRSDIPCLTTWNQDQWKNLEI